jgi:hypothetical protein
MSMKRLDVPFRSTIQNAGAVAVDEVDHPSPLFVEVTVVASQRTTVY